MFCYREHLVLCSNHIYKQNEKPTSKTIYPKHNDKSINIGPCPTCNGPHLIKHCNESTCGRFKPNLDKHMPTKCPRKCPFNRQQSPNPFHNAGNGNRNKINNHTEPNLQLSILTNKPDHIAELLKATIKMTKYFKRSYKQSKPHLSDNSDSHINTKHYSTSHSDKHKCKPCNNNDEVNEVLN